MMQSGNHKKRSVRDNDLKKLDVLLKMFDIDAFCEYNKGVPFYRVGDQKREALVDNKSKVPLLLKTWRPYPYRLYFVSNDHLSTTFKNFMFGSFHELEMMVHKLTSEQVSPPEVAEEICSICEGGGWECYGLGNNDPHFKECEDCGNPDNLRSP